MATPGYSGTPLLQKLGINSAMKILLINQPDNYFSWLETNITDQLCRKNETPDLVHLFVKNNKEFEEQMKKLKSFFKTKPAITIWVSWYKKTALRQAQGKLSTDVTEDTIRNYALRNGLVDVKVCAVSEIWSGLKLVIPLAKRTRI
jgi:CMP-N-acetylneuraminic acid synthetase